MDQISKAHSGMSCWHFSLFYAVENNCGYHLFESDSEEEEEEVTERKEEEEPMKKKSALQVRIGAKIEILISVLFIISQDEYLMSLIS